MRAMRGLCWPDNHQIGIAGQDPQENLIGQAFPRNFIGPFRRKWIDLKWIADGQTA
jgi:hypothetical protein